MKRIIIICEGQTEQEFCNKTLSPYFSAKQILIQAPLIKKSNGGIVRWSELKKQIENHLKQDTTAYVTTLIDYYGISDNLSFPGWTTALTIVDKNERLDFLEQSMRDDIDAQLNYRVMPYMQLHEFEGLLFSDINVFEQQFTAEEIMNVSLLHETFQTFSDNPEMINDSLQTAPSKRLANIVSGYDKVVYGNILAEVVGLQNMVNKCPRFCAWIKQLEDV
jgi:hypothetical protein